MFQINEILTKAPFSLSKIEKSNLFGEALFSLNRHHYQNCSEYKSILDALKYDQKTNYNYEQFPFLPINLFKNYELSSIDEEKIVKTMNSSGTSGQGVSEIYLDKENAFLQTKVLTKIVSTVIKL